MNEMQEFEKISYIRPTLFLGHKAFLSWMMREELMSETEAKAKWDTALSDAAHRRKKEDGVVKLAVAGHSYEAHEKGRIAGTVERKQGDGWKDGKEFRQRAMDMGESRDQQGHRSGGRPAGSRDLMMIVAVVPGAAAVARMALLAARLHQHRLAIVRPLRLVLARSRNLGMRGTITL